MSSRTAAAWSLANTDAPHQEGRCPNHVKKKIALNRANGRSLQSSPRTEVATIPSYSTNISMSSPSALGDAPPHQTERKHQRRCGISFWLFFFFCRNPITKSMVFFRGFFWPKLRTIICLKHSSFNCHSSSNLSKIITFIPQQKFSIICAISFLSRIIQLNIPANFQLDNNISDAIFLFRKHIPNLNCMHLCLCSFGMMLSKLWLCICSNHQTLIISAEFVSQLLCPKSIPILRLT